MDWKKRRKSASSRIKDLIIERNGLRRIIAELKQKLHRKDLLLSKDYQCSTCGKRFSNGNYYPINTRLAEKKEERDSNGHTFVHSNGLRGRIHQRNDFRGKVSIIRDSQPHPNHTNPMDQDLLDLTDSTSSVAMDTDEMVDPFVNFPTENVTTWGNPSSIESSSLIPDFEVRPFYLDDLRLDIVMDRSRLTWIKDAKLVCYGLAFSENLTNPVTHGLFICQYGITTAVVTLDESSPVKPIDSWSIVPPEIFLPGSVSHDFFQNWNRLVIKFPSHHFPDSVRRNVFVEIDFDVIPIRSATAMIPLEKVYPSSHVQALQDLCYTLLVFSSVATNNVDLSRLIGSDLRVDLSLCRGSDGHEFKAVTFSTGDYDDLVLRLLQLNLDFCLANEEDSEFSTGTKNWYYISDESRDTANALPDMDAVKSMIMDLTAEFGVTNVFHMWEKHRGTISFSSRQARCDFLRDTRFITSASGKRGLRHAPTNIFVDFQMNVPRCPLSITETSWTLNTARVRRADHTNADRVFQHRDKLGRLIKPWLAVHSFDGVTNSMHFVFATQLDALSYQGLEMDLLGVSTTCARSIDLWRYRAKRGDKRVSEVAILNANTQSQLHDRLDACEGNIRGALQAVAGELEHLHTRQDALVQSQHAMIQAISLSSSTFADQSNINSIRTSIRKIETKIQDVELEMMDDKAPADLKGKLMKLQQMLAAQMAKLERYQDDIDTKVSQMSSLTEKASCSLVQASTPSPQLRLLHHAIPRMDTSPMKDGNRPSLSGVPKPLLGDVPQTNQDTESPQVVEILDGDGSTPDNAVGTVLEIDDLLDAAMTQVPTQESYQSHIKKRKIDSNDTNQQ